MAPNGQEMDVNAIAPFVRSEHGYLVLMEDETEGCVNTASGDALLFMCGMIHGTLEAMIAQVDYAFLRARARGVARVSAIVDASRPSFRVPDVLMHRVFKHLRRYEDALGDIFFWRTPALKMRGMRLFVLPLLPSSLQSRVKFCSSLHPIAPAAADPGSWDKLRYLRWRAADEGVALTSDVRDFDVKGLADGRRMLDEDMRAHRSALEAMPFHFTRKMRKRGRGGALGTTRWKDKVVRVDDSCLYYTDSTAIGVVELSSIVRVDLVDDFTAQIDCGLLQPYLFAASTPADISEFSAVLWRLKSEMTSHKSSG